jgi:hypothetical protein
MQRTWGGSSYVGSWARSGGCVGQVAGNGRNEHAQRDRPHRRGAWRRRLQSKSLVLLITKAIDGLLSRSGGGPSMDSRRPVVLYVRTLGGGLSLQLDLAFDFEQRRVVARPLLIRTIVEGLRRIDPRRDSLVERAPARRRFRSRRPHSNSSSINGSPAITTGSRARLRAPVRAAAASTGFTCFALDLFARFSSTTSSSAFSDIGHLDRARILATSFQPLFERLQTAKQNPVNEYMPVGCGLLVTTLWMND